MRHYTSFIVFDITSKITALTKSGLRRDVKTETNEGEGERGKVKASSLHIT